MFAPLDWDTERFFNLHHHTVPFENGLAYETRQRPRSTRQLPPFERAFKDMRHETRMFNLMNETLYHRLLRDCALEHVLNEWGVLAYNRLVFKMPNDSHGADFIMRAFPRAWMIFLMRDGRDVMRSRFTPFASDVLAETTDASLRTQAIAYYAHFWNFQVDIMRDAYDAHAADRRHFLRYEDVRQNPAVEIPRLLDRIGLSVAEAELPRLLHDVTLENMPADQRGPNKPRQDGRVGGFRDTFSPAEIEMMDSIMGTNLRRYGYQTG
jgi:hypothetical protein